MAMAWSKLDIMTTINLEGLLVEASLQPATTAQGPSGFHLFRKPKESAFGDSTVVMQKLPSALGSSSPMDLLS